MALLLGVHRGSEGTVPGGSKVGAVDQRSEDTELVGSMFVLDYVGQKHVLGVGSTPG